MSVLKTRLKDHTLWTVIDRPEAKNSINFEVMDALETVLDRAEEDENIRVFVLGSSGDHIFISGGDLKEFHTLKSAEEAKPMALRMISLLERLEKLPCWTLASVSGAAYGGGCEMLLAFDFRIASQHARFGFTQGKFYLPPGWGGLTRLVEQVGRSTALRWLAERAVIDSETAHRHKLIDRIVPGDKLEHQTKIWAEELSFNDRHYINTLKQGSFRAGKSRRESIREELDPFARFWEDKRHHQRVESFLSREKNS